MSSDGHPEWQGVSACLSIKSTVLFAPHRRVARFFLVQHTKTGKIYQIIIKYTKLPQNIPTNGRNINQMTIKYIKIFLCYLDPPKFTHIGIFVLKINHLATLPRSRAKVSLVRRVTGCFRKKLAQNVAQSVSSHI
jgi:hypothetical protein